MRRIAANINLESLHEKCDGFPQDFKRALKCYLKVIRLGHAHAQVSVGDLIQDTSMAMGWYDKTVYQRNTSAQRRIVSLRLAESRQSTAVPPPGTLSWPTQEKGKAEEGIGNATDVIVPTTTTRRNSAHVLEERFTIADNPAARPSDRPSQLISNDQEQHNHDFLDLKHFSNQLQPQAPKEHVAPATQDITQAILSARLGEKEARFTLGDVFRNGHGSPQNYQAAIDWYLKAGNQGQVAAQCSVGDLYQGQAEAQDSIGIVHTYGHGVPQE
ncbi:hypothetical protein BGX23_003839 [Mortierella sp. AD031]|nr:hypothetical protein BGX23_003839 [Mortierella sp. AD031]